ncbi:hypothetical protein B0A50_04737 [Salinomyces thailandicus]|uniref:C2H2-type domain-containing protein n=1 Tax=Salinomyces thailandicus TaxID=706561 RepID=A0A4V5N472_9PEZI|nr:hypothetical protein B0A50_04737 [Salinomyces thailandica]
MASKRTREDSVSSAENVSPPALVSHSPSVESNAHTPKYATLEPDIHHTASTMKCLMPPHKPLSFNTYSEYESHYQQSHTNRCLECNKNFPSSHFLELHIAENHDPIVASRREKGDKTYACFVEGCDKICGEWKKRRSHMVDKHAFPRNYDFFVVNSGIDGRRSMLRPGVDAQGHRRSSRERPGSSSTETTVSTAATSASEQGKQAEASSNGKIEVDELTSSLSSLKMVPRSIRFGKRGRAGLAKS